MTTDHEAKLACQLTSVRFPTAINVGVGLTQLSDSAQSKTLRLKFMDSHLKPMAMQVDALQPVQWYHQAISL